VVGLGSQRDDRAYPQRSVKEDEQRQTAFFTKTSPASHDFYNLQPVPRPDLAISKFGRRHRFAIVVHHHTAGQQLLGEQKRLERAGELASYRLAVGDDKIFFHGLGDGVEHRYY
jgi:hypothetical protein